MDKNLTNLPDIIFTYYPQIRKVYRNLASIKGLSISMTQLTCLTVLRKKGALSMTELANQLSMSNQQLTKMVDTLAEMQLVERVEDERNRRKVLATLTEKGNATTDALYAEAKQKLAKFLAKRTAEEIAMLHQSVAIIASYFDEKE